MADNTDINKNLLNLGFSEKEIQIYQLLLTRDTASITNISKSTNIPRTTIYRICEDLINKNLLEWVIDQNGKKARCSNINSLRQIIFNKKDELENISKVVNNLISVIKYNPKKVPQTQVRYYKGKEGTKQIVWNTLEAEKETLGYSVYGRKEIIGEKFNNKFAIEFKKRNLIDRVITNQKFIPRIKKALAGIHQQIYDHVRIIPEKDFYVSGDTYIYNNIYAVSFWNKDEIVGVEIENPEIAKVQKSIFNYLWLKAVPLVKFIKS